MMWPYKAGGPTTSFNYHLKTHHARDFLENKPQALQQTKVRGRYPVSVNWKFIDCAICGLYATCAHTKRHRIMDWRTLFRRFAHNTLRPMTPELMIHVENLVCCKPTQLMFLEMKQHLTSLQDRIFWLSCDGWSSVSWVLCVQQESDHTSEHLAEETTKH